MVTKAKNIRCSKKNASPVKEWMQWSGKYPLRKRHLSWDMNEMRVKWLSQEHMWCVLGIAWSPVWVTWHKSGWSNKREVVSTKPWRLYRPEYRQWILLWNRKSLKHLEQGNEITSSAFWKKSSTTLSSTDCKGTRAEGKCISFLLPL